MKTGRSELSSRNLLADSQWLSLLLVASLALPFAVRATTVKRTGALFQASTIRYATADGTATAGKDYTAKTGTLSFAAHESSKSFTVPIINNTFDEADETFFVNLSAPVNASIADNQGRGVITDDD